MKTTIKLEGERKIREMLEQSLLLTDLRNYAEGMSNFYWKKAHDLLKAMASDLGREKAEQEIYGKYRDVLTGLPDDHYLVLTAMDNFMVAHRFVDTFDDRVKAMTKYLFLEPVSGEYDGDDNEADAWLDIDMQVFERFSDDIVKGMALGDLWGGSTGFDDSEYGEMLDLYLGEDRK